MYLGSTGYAFALCDKRWFIGMQMQNTYVDSYSNQCYQYSFKFVFVLGLGMKIEGVALGTLIAQYLGLYSFSAMVYILS